MVQVEQCLSNVCLNIERYNKLQRCVPQKPVILDKDWYLRMVVGDGVVAPENQCSCIKTGLSTTSGSIAKVKDHTSGYL